jgi:hypothetical protein
MSSNNNNNNKRATGTATKWGSSMIWALCTAVALLEFTLFSTPALPSYTEQQAQLINPQYWKLVHYTNATIRIQNDQNINDNPASESHAAVTPTLLAQDAHIARNSKGLHTADEEALPGDKTTVLRILERAGVSNMTSDIVATLPDTALLEALYGPLEDSIVWGRHLCQQYRDTVPSDQRYVGTYRKYHALLGAIWFYRVILCNA